MWSGQGLGSLHEAVVPWLEPEGSKGGRSKRGGRGQKGTVRGG